jgi:hypothetical protein
LKRAGPAIAASVNFGAAAQPGDQWQHEFLVNEVFLLTRDAFAAFFTDHWWQSRTEAYRGIHRMFPLQTLLRPPTAAGNPG